jgi:hypothetical protein
MPTTEYTESRWVKQLRECKTRELEFMVKTIQAIIDERNDS